MHTDYEDIRTHIAEPPAWFDEHAVPRYTKFHPRRLANIYAREGVLMEIACQCGHTFKVAISLLSFNDISAGRPHDEANKPIRTIADLIRYRRISYGDPQNIGCCSTGAMTTSEPRRILEYWRREPPTRDWERDTALEINLEPWVGGDQ